MGADEYAEFWGSDRLTRWSAEILAGVRIPEASKAFLQDIGLPPTQGVVGLDYRWETSLPVFSAGRRVLGRYFGAPLLIDENAGGHVLRPSLAALPGSSVKMNPERWYNSSVEQYAQFLTEFAKFFKSSVRTDAAFDALEERLGRLDPAAVDKNGPWGLLIWEERTGITD